MLLLGAVPICGLILSLSQLTSALLALPYHPYINLTFLAYLSLLLKSSSSLASSPPVPCLLFSILLFLSHWQIPTSKITPACSHRPLYLHPVLLLSWKPLLLPSHTHRKEWLTSSSVPQEPNFPHFTQVPTSCLQMYQYLLIANLPAPNSYYAKWAISLCLRLLH